MFITTIHSINSLEKLKNAGADAVVIGIDYFSIRSSVYIPIKDLKVWKEKCDRLGLKLYINFLRLCMDKDLDKVRTLFAMFKDMEIDGIYYADEGLYYEAKKIGLENKLIYQPETLVASSMDANYYASLGIQSVSLAHELSLVEVLSIAKKNSDIEILIHGYFSILYSKRPLVTNYLEAIQHPVCSLPCRYDLIEQTRDERMPIIQDETGTHIFSEMPINSLEEMQDFISAGLHRFRIDSIFFDDDWTVEILSLYQLALQGIRVSDDESSNRWYLEETIKKKEEQ